jgi:hypothetical protein
MKKRICILILMLLIAINLPISEANNFEENKTNEQTTESFYNCQVVSSGITEKQVSMGLVKIMNFAFAFLIEIQYGEDGESFIYNANSGIEEWHHAGMHKLKLIIYRGSLSYQNLGKGSLKTLIDGRVLFVKVEAL